MARTALLIEQSELDVLRSLPKIVSQLQAEVNKLKDRPELQEWVTANQVMKRGILGVTSFEAFKPKLNELVALKKVRTQGNKYNLNDLQDFMNR